MKDWKKIPLDGCESLIEGFDGIEAFVKKVIENCIFFVPEIVRDRFNYVIDHLHLIDNSSKESAVAFMAKNKNSQILPVRKSEKKRVYYSLKASGDFNDRTDVRVVKIDMASKNTKQDCLVCIDKDGNYAVKELIKCLTGCVVNGNKRTLKHYVISHIWGQASDPRFFSNLWNIVLVPSYANPLLDVNYESDLDHAGAILLNTIKAVIAHFYKFDELDWGKIGIVKPSYNKDCVITVADGFEIHYLKNKCDASLNPSTVQEIGKTIVKI